MKLTRSRKGRMLAGVCVGIADRFGWDVTVLRLFAVVATLFAGSSVLVYVALWVLMPDDDL